MGLFSATAIVMGSMIGSGIFIVSADMSRVLGSPALLIAAWLVTAVMTIIGALSYGELAAMMPKAGGQYVYLREALGPLWGFLYGWTLFLVIQTGTIAAVGVAFGKFLGVFFPSVSRTGSGILACSAVACGADGAGQYGHRVEYGEPCCDVRDYSADIY
jgi:APA family basic amino acid/polyamine antiporter